MSATPEPKLNYRGQFVVRTLGTIFIIACCTMIVGGETVLKDDLHGPQFLLFWTWCFLITLLAGLAAVVDLIFIRRAGRQTRRKLLEREILGKR